MRGNLGVYHKTLLGSFALAQQGLGVPGITGRVRGCRVEFLDAQLLQGRQKLARLRGIGPSKGKGLLSPANAPSTKDWCWGRDLIRRRG